MTKKLEKIIAEYKSLSNNHERGYSQNKYIKELRDFYEGIKFLKKYFRDPEIKNVKAQHTEAIHEDLVNNHNYSYKFATKIAKAVPMPIENKIGRAIVAFGLGMSLGRIHEENVDIITKYAGLTKTGYRWGCFWAETFNNPFSAFQQGIGSWIFDYTANEIYSAITGDNSRPINTNDYYPFGYLAITTIHTMKSAVDVKLGRKYQDNKLMLTRFPSIITYSLSLAHRRHLRKTAKQSENRHKS